MVLSQGRGSCMGVKWSLVVFHELVCFHVFGVLMFERVLIASLTFAIDWHTLTHKQPGGGDWSHSAHVKEHPP